MNRAPRPLSGASFHVDLGTGDDAAGGFTQVLLPPLAVAAREAAPVQPVVVLRRPMTGAPDLVAWWQAEREGAGEARRTVIVTLLSDAGEPVLRWRIAGARPVTIAHGPLDAMSDAILLETIELAFERIDVETMQG